MFLNFLFLFLFLSLDIAGYFPVGLNRFDEVIYQPYNWNCNQVNGGFYFDGAIKVNGRNDCSFKVNPLAIWDCDQDALAMIRGFPSCSDIGQLASQLNSSNDDGIRGHLDFCGNLNIEEMAFALRYYAKNYFYFDLFLPIYFIDLKSVEYKDLTRRTMFDDFLVREYLTNDLKNIVEDLGGLKIEPWSKAGPGDLVISLGWIRNFDQDRPILTNVRGWVDGAITVPTGIKRDEDLIFSMPFGNDGSWGISGHGNLELSWWPCFVGGIDVRFMYLFGNSKVRRIKTDINQTELLLLAKCDSYMSYGSTQQYFLYLRAQDFCKRFSFTAAYNYIFKHEDEIFLKGNCYSTNTANTSKQLEDWTIHNFIFMLTYDGQNKCTQGPRASLFCKIPFNGRRSLQAGMLGVELDYSF